MPTFSMPGVWEVTKLCSVHVCACAHACFNGVLRWQAVAPFHTQLATVAFVSESPHLSSQVLVEFTSSLN